MVTVNTSDILTSYDQTCQSKYYEILYKRGITTILKL